MAERICGRTGEARTFVDWLLDAEPAIRWQAMRDLTDATPAAIVSERTRVASEGIGAEILNLQQPNGTWRRANTPAWLSTLFTLLLLRATGVDHTQPAVASAVARCSELRSGWCGRTLEPARQSNGWKPLLRRGGRALHQRWRARSWRLLRAPSGTSYTTPYERAVARWGMELRSAKKHPLLFSHYYLCPRRTA